MKRTLTVKEQKLVDLMKQYIYASGPRMLGDLVAYAISDYSDGDDNDNPSMTFAHVNYGIASGFYDLGLNGSK